MKCEQHLVTTKSSLNLTLLDPNQIGEMSKL